MWHRRFLQRRVLSHLEKTFLNEVGGKEASGDETVVEFICLERTLWVDLSDHFQNRGKRPRRWNGLSWVTHVWKLTPVTLHRGLERNADEHHELSAKRLPGAFYTVSVSLGKGSQSISDGLMRWPNSLFFFFYWDPWQGSSVIPRPLPSSTLISGYRIHSP